MTKTKKRKKPVEASEDPESWHEVCSSSEPLSPEETLDLAQQAPGLWDYWPAIEELRRKEFSWRSISQWLATNAGVTFHYKRLERFGAERAKKQGAEPQKDL